MPLEDDDLFKDRPRPIPRGKDAHHRVPYHEMTEEQRRAAWAEMREAQRVRARKGRLAPLLWLAGGAAAFIVGAAFAAMGYGGPGRVMNWLGVVLVAFALVSMGRGLLGRSSGKKDDFAPPGF